MEKQIFRRKALEKLKHWKEHDAPRYAILLEGPRRVGKSTIAEEFAKKEYKSYIKIDFADIRKEVLDVFDDISDLNTFFLRLQAVTGISLYQRESVIIFDEIQLQPKVRQAIKYLVIDGRYDYIETGSLISIRKNVRDIVIPSEEKKLSIYPMDYEEFLSAIGKNTYSLLRQLYQLHKPIGDSTNRKLMRDFRIYMAVGGMPQAIEAYVEGKNFAKIDEVKREIINLYKDDFHKVDKKNIIQKMFASIPGQLAENKKNYVISRATGKKRIDKDRERLLDLIDSRTVLPCYDVLDPSITLSQSIDTDIFKLYLSDTGLFTTLIFDSSDKTEDNIYAKLLGDSLKADMGYLYENIVAQMIVSSGRPLYYHTWKKEGNPHSREIDFLLSSKTKLIPIEVKSSSTKSHKSITEFTEKYSNQISTSILLSQKDVGHDGNLRFYPIYMLPFILEEL